jgi:CRP/FNR family cyclic AMP-dependent transcriptional regulator
MPEMSEMSPKERDALAAQTLIAHAPIGTVVVYRGEASNSAYFILKGTVGVGVMNEEEYAIVNYLREGDFFGEIAALMGATRTANVITETDCELLVIPSKVMKQLARQYAGLREVFYTTITDRLRVIELPRGTSLDQEMLRELRTRQPDMKAEPPA